MDQQLVDYEVGVNLPDRMSDGEPEVDVKGEHNDWQTDYDRLVVESLYDAPETTHEETKEEEAFGDWVRRTVGQVDENDVPERAISEADERWVQDSGRVVAGEVVEGFTDYDYVVDGAFDEEREKIRRGFLPKSAEVRELEEAFWKLSDDERWERLNEHVYQSPSLSEAERLDESLRSVHYRAYREVSSYVLFGNGLGYNGIVRGLPVWDDGTMLKIATREANRRVSGENLEEGVSAENQFLWQIHYLGLVARSLVKSDLSQFELTADEEESLKFLSRWTTAVSRVMVNGPEIKGDFWDRVEEVLGEVGLGDQFRKEYGDPKKVASVVLEKYEWIDKEVRELYEDRTGDFEIVGLELWGLSRAETEWLSGRIRGWADMMFFGDVRQWEMMKGVYLTPGFAWMPMEKEHFRYMGWADYVTPPSENAVYLLMSTSGNDLGLEHFDWVVRHEFAHMVDLSLPEEAKERLIQVVEGSDVLDELSPKKMHGYLEALDREYYKLELIAEAIQLYFGKYDELREKYPEVWREVHYAYTDEWVVLDQGERVQA